MEISRYLRDKAREIAGRSQFFINSYAKALEVCIVGPFFLDWLFLIVTVASGYYSANA